MWAGKDNPKTLKIVSPLSPGWVDDITESLFAPKPYPTVVTFPLKLA